VLRGDGIFNLNLIEFVKTNQSDLFLYITTQIPKFILYSKTGFKRVF